MSIRNLEHLFEPKSIAVIGASRRPHSVGETVMRNMAEGGFRGRLYPVNPKYEEVAGHKAYARIRDLPEAPDLAVICTPAATVPDVVARLAAAGTKAAIVITAGLNAPAGGDHDRGETLKERMLKAAQPSLMRILGPNCVGMLNPALGINASFAHTHALPGKLAFLSQSGALVTGVLDWAKSRGIGFSKFVSLGDSADIDFGDMLDYLASDADTQAILMYIEDIRHARKFMSAARAAARAKPVVVVKAGRAPEAAQAAASHTGALAGADGVYDAAIRRAGMVRVFSTKDLFGTVEALAAARPLHGERLTILTNGGGPGVMATDALIAARGQLARLEQDTIRRLDAVLPAGWSHGNPVDIIGDAPVERYVAALGILLEDRASDAILFIHAPTAIVDSADIAQALVPLARDASRHILSCWLGGAALEAARQRFAAAGIPTFDTPEEAVSSYMQIVRYHRAQQLLMEVPSSEPVEFTPDRERAREIVRGALAAGRPMLTEPESKALLAAYDIPVVATRIAATPEEAAAAAREIGFPVAVKILSPDISHKSDVGGVALDIESADAAQAAAGAMQRRLRELLPGARLEGFTVQAMARRPQAHELIAGVTTDPVFGPVILFGQGGVAVEVTADHAIALPPLNQVLARDLISQTRVAKLLAGYRNRPPADCEAICRVLIRLSHLVADVAEIIELDINPLLADHQGVIALDARVRIAAQSVPGASGVDRLAIRPYPEALEEWANWQGQSILLRPVRPEDGPAHLAFFKALDPEDVRYRMFVRMKELLPSQLARLTQIDYDREMAFIAVRRNADGVAETLGVARAIADPDNETAEFAVTVRSDLKGLGLGSLLMSKLIAYCRRRQTRELVGEALCMNTRVLNMASRLGFRIEASADGETRVMRLPLQSGDGS